LSRRTVSYFLVEIFIRDEFGTLVPRLRRLEFVDVHAVVGGDDDYV